MGNQDLTGNAWRDQVSRRRPLAHDARVLGELVEQDHDPAEASYHEAVADPDAQALDDAQRSYAGQYLRRLRRLHERDRHADINDT